MYENIMDDIIIKKGIIYRNMTGLSILKNGKRIFFYLRYEQKIEELKKLLLKKFPGIVVRNSFEWESRKFKKEDKLLSGDEMLLYHSVTDDLEVEAFNLHAMAPNRAAELQKDVNRYKNQHIEYFKL